MIARIVIVIIACIAFGGCVPANRQAGRQQQSELMGKDPMEPKIIQREAFKVLGTMTRITPEEEQSEKYGRIWKEFESYHDQIKALSLDGKYYGVTFHTENEGVFDYMAGMAVKSVDSLPEGLVSRDIPTAWYAVFECSVRDIAVTYQTIFGKWLPGAHYEINPAAPSFEQYPPEGEESAPVYIHIPINNRGDEDE